MIRQSKRSRIRFRGFEGKIVDPAYTVDSPQDYDDL